MASDFLKSQTNYQGYETCSPALPKCKYAKTTAKDSTYEGKKTGSVDSRPLNAGGGKANWTISNPKNH